MKLKIFILVSLVLCLTLSVGISFADTVPFTAFSDYDFVVYGADSDNNNFLNSQSVTVGYKHIVIATIFDIIDLNADIYVGTITYTVISDSQYSINSSENLTATFIEQSSEEYLLTLADGLYIYVDTDLAQTYLFGIITNSMQTNVSISPLLVGYEKTASTPIQSGLFVDAYNWFNDTFFSGEIPPVMESLSEEISTIFALLFIISIIAIPIFLVWVVVKSVVAMSLFNR